MHINWGKTLDAFEKLEQSNLVQLEDLTHFVQRTVNSVML